MLFRRYLMKEVISLPLLSQIVLDDETIEILKTVEDRKRSEFIRKAIMSLAIEKGHKSLHSNPVYMPAKKWNEVIEHQEKSRRADYNYVVAYFWLKSLPQYGFLQKSEIVRMAIKAFYWKLQAE